MLPQNGESRLDDATFESIVEFFMAPPVKYAVCNRDRVYTGSFLLTHSLYEVDMYDDFLVAQTNVTWTPGELYVDYEKQTIQTTTNKYAFDPLKRMEEVHFYPHLGYLSEIKWAVKEIK